MEELVTGRELEPHEYLLDLALLGGLQQLQQVLIKRLSPWAPANTGPFLFLHWTGSFPTWHPGVAHTGLNTTLAPTPWPGPLLHPSPTPMEKQELEP